MRQIFAYTLFISAFVSISWATATGQKRCMNLLVFFLGIAPPALLYIERPLEMASFCMGGFFLFDLFIRLLHRRRVVPPCVRTDFAPGLWLFTIALLLLILSAFLCPVGLTRFPWTPVSLLLISVGGFLNMMVYQRPEICANGLWYGGELQEWSNYESFSWCVNDDKTIVELYFPKEFRTLSHPAKRIAVPHENSDAAKKLLEMNLAKSAPEKVKA